MIAGPRNSITDVSGLAVGSVHDGQLASGVTAILCEEAAVAAVAPGGTWITAVVLFPAHSYTRKIKEFESSAFFTAVRTTFSGSTAAKECAAGSDPECAVVATACSG